MFSNIQKRFCKYVFRTYVLQTSNGLFVIARWGIYVLITAQVHYFLLFLDVSHQINNWILIQSIQRNDITVYETYGFVEYIGISIQPSLSDATKLATEKNFNLPCSQTNRSLIVKRIDLV